MAGRIHDIFGHFDLLPDAVVVTNTQGTIVCFNKQAERLFGYSEDKVIGLPLEVLMPARYREIHARHRQTFYSDPSVRPMGARQQLFGLREDSIEFPVDIMLSPFRSGKDTFSIAVVRDATDRVRSDQLLQDAKQQLELRVRERTHEWSGACWKTEAALSIRESAFHVGTYRRHPLVPRSPDQRFSLSTEAFHQV